MRYTTWGSCRGCCGHAHLTAEAAEKCLAADERSCKRQGGFSDRVVREINSAADIEDYDVTRGPGKSASFYE